MSTPTIPEHFPEAWDNAWVSALQLGDDRFAGATAVDTITGDRQWYNIGGTKEFKEITARHPATSHVDYSTEKSWIYLRDYDSPTLLDEKDQRNLDSIALPTSRIMRDDVAAFVRLKMAKIRDAATGSRITGENGTTTEAFPTGNIVAVNYGGGGDVGLTWGKITEVTQLMDTADVPLNDRCFVIGPKQKQDLMSLAQATDRDYANTVLIKNGTIHGTVWAGFKWIEYNGLAFDPSDADARQCFAYYKDDIVYADDGYKSHMDILPTQNHALQIRPVVGLGACRVRNSSYIVKCVES